MKQSIPIGVAVAAVVVVAAIALFFGIRSLNVGHHQTQYSGASYASKMAELQQKQNQQMQSRTSGGGSDEYANRMRQMMQNSAHSYK